LLHGYKVVVGAVSNVPSELFELANSISVISIATRGHVYKLFFHQRALILSERVNTHVVESTSGAKTFQ